MTVLHAMRRSDEIRGPAELLPPSTEVSDEQHTDMAAFDVHE
ncbi:hypothetical protein [Streptomyces sp. MMG1121]|nr:hypothetical protein [Streptomyces sp. MMG1121]